jgi:hypothetical protein
MNFNARLKSDVNLLDISSTRNGGAAYRTYMPL